MTTILVQPNNKPAYHIDTNMTESQVKEARSLGILWDKLGLDETARTWVFRLQSEVDGYHGK